MLSEGHVTRKNKVRDRGLREGPSSNLFRPGGGESLFEAEVALMGGSQPCENLEDAPLGD